MSKESESSFLEYQKKFLHAWPGLKKQKLAMSWPAGSGAVWTLSELVRRASRNERILLIADRVEFANQFVYLLHKKEVQASFVDRQQFLFLQSEVGVDLLEWQRFKVFALTKAMAMKGDVLASLSQQSWDIVLFLDTSLATTLSLTKSLMKAKTRALWKVSPGCNISSLDRSEWSIDFLSNRDVVKENDLVSAEALQIAIETIELMQHEKGLAISTLIDELLQVTKGTQVRGIVNTLREKWLSSPAAFESTLRKVEAALKWQWPLWGGGDDDLEDVKVVDVLDEASKLQALQLVGECLEVLDELDVDCKLTVLLDYLKKRFNKQSSCVFVRYRDTATYLYTALEDEGIPCVLIHGGMSAAEVNAELARFMQEPSLVLVMTTAMLVGMDLRVARTLVLYDAPATSGVLSQILARFHVVGLLPLSVAVIGTAYEIARTQEQLESAVQFVV